MKRICWLLFFFFILLSGVSYAQDGQIASPAPTATPKIKDDLREKIDDLKERLATRVAEIRSQSKRAFYGQIKEKDDSSFVLENGDKKTTVAYDEETVFEEFQNGKKTESDASILTDNKKVAAFGILDLDQKTLVAKRIIVKTILEMRVGKISEVDVNDGTLKVQGASENLVFDYEIRTKCLLWNAADQKLVSCGLSKIKEGYFAVIRGEENEEKNFTILRILVLPYPTSLPKPAS